MSFETQVYRTADLFSQTHHFPNTVRIEDLLQCWCTLQCYRLYQQHKVNMTKKCTSQNIINRKQKEIVNFSPNQSNIWKKIMLLAKDGKIAKILKNDVIRVDQLAYPKSHFTVRNCNWEKLLSLVDFAKKSSPT